MIRSQRLWPAAFQEPFKCNPSACTNHSKEEVLNMLNVVLQSDMTYCGLNHRSVLKSGGNHGTEQNLHAIRTWYTMAATTHWSKELFYKIFHIYCVNGRQTIVSKTVPITVTRKSQLSAPQCVSWKVMRLPKLLKDTMKHLQPFRSMHFILKPRLHTNSTEISNNNLQ